MKYEDWDAYLDKHPSMIEKEVISLNDGTYYVLYRAYNCKGNGHDKIKGAAEKVAKYDLIIDLLDKKISLDKR